MVIDGTGVATEVRLMPAAAQRARKALATSRETRMMWARCSRSIDDEVYLRSPRVGSDVFAAGGAGSANGFAAALCREARARRLDDAPVRAWFSNPGVTGPASLNLASTIVCGVRVTSRLCKAMARTATGRCRRLERLALAKRGLLAVTFSSDWCRQTAAQYISGRWDCVCHRLDKSDPGGSVVRWCHKRCHWRR